MLKSGIDAVVKKLEPGQVRSKISPNFRQMLVLGGFPLWLEELPPVCCGLRFGRRRGKMQINADKMNFRPRA